MRELPHLVYLQAFESAARHLSFTRAAVELNCTQAAISQRVRGLEQYFGRPLFQRLPNGLALSSAGKAYLPGITQALDMAEAATRGLTGRQARQTVTLSAPISFLALWLAPRLARFQAEFLEIGLRLNSAIWTDPNVEVADVSVGIAEPDRLPSDAVPLAFQRLVLAATPPIARALSQGAPLDAQCLIEVQGKYRLWDMWADARAVTLSPGRPAILVDNALAALDLAAAGAGVTVVYSTYADALQATGRIAMPFDGVAVPHLLALTHSPGRRPTPAVRAFANWLSGEFPAVERQIGDIRE